MRTWDDHLPEAAGYDSESRNDVVPRASRNIIADPEVWADYHSEFLVVGYHVLKDQFESMGVPILNACTFSNFVSFCFKHSSGHKPKC
jgi:hypothetical protein